MSLTCDFDEIKDRIIYPIIQELQKLDNELVIGGSKMTIKDNPFNRVYNAVEGYKSLSITFMNDEMLDRHKLAACLCGAIMTVKPIIRKSGKNKNKIPKPNESLAVISALILMKPFIIRRFFDLHPILIKHKNNALQTFQMGFPDEIICDKKKYRDNLFSALTRAFSGFEMNQNDEICEKYDIWAYSKIFYHLDIHNYHKLSEQYLLL